MPAQLSYCCQAFLWNEIFRQANEIDIIRYFITGLRQSHNCLKTISLLSGDISLLFHCFPGLFHWCLVIFHYYFITISLFPWSISLLSGAVLLLFHCLPALFHCLPTLFHCCLVIFHYYFIVSLRFISLLSGNILYLFHYFPRGYFFSVVVLLFVWFLMRSNHNTWPVNCLNLHAYFIINLYYGLKSKQI